MGANLPRRSQEAWPDAEMKNDFAGIFSLSGANCSRSRGRQRAVGDHRPGPLAPEQSIGTPTLEHCDIFPVEGVSILCSLSRADGSPRRLASGQLECGVWIGSSAHRESFSVRFIQDLLVQTSRLLPVLWMARATEPARLPSITTSAGPKGII
jgi:hypothetical protein